jgi:hypothetical protein
MNPYVRNLGSFGLIPLILTTIPPVRSHLLRRYRRAISITPEFQHWLQHYLPPEEIYLPPLFLDKLKMHRSLLLIGESGIGKTSFLQFLTAYLTSQPSLSPKTRNIIPVFVPLARYRNHTPVAMIQAQLENFGRLTDEVLTSWMVKHGGFLIMFDGMNEVDKLTRDAVNSFVEGHWQAHWISISSQEAYQEFNHWKSVLRLEPLPSEKVRELIRLRLGPEKAARILERMTEQHYKFYSLPQNLDLAIEFLSEPVDWMLPRTEPELYATIFEPQFEAWSEVERRDLPELLIERAYIMLRDKRSADFDGKGQRVPLPDEVRDLLLAKRLFVQRAEDVFFRHDLLRAYLAARYFESRWARLLEADGSQLDANWLTMLQFAARRIAQEAGPDGSQTVYSLVEVVFHANPDVSAHLVEWLEREMPEISLPWRDAFDQQYGRVRRKWRVA